MVLNIQILSLLEKSSPVSKRQIQIVKFVVSSSDLICLRVTQHRRYARFQNGL